MALKITTAINTNKGVTSQAYVRIADYHVSKSGNASFRIEIFQSEFDKSVTNYADPRTDAGQVYNQQIGDHLQVQLTKTVNSVKTVSKYVQVDVEATATIPAYKTWVTKDVEEPYTEIVPDLSPLEKGSIFDFAYGQLKAKLEGLFGAKNVVDC